MAWLLELNPYTVGLFALALALSAHHLVQVVAAFVRALPGIGGALAPVIEKIGQPIANACGRLAGGVSRHIGHSLHGAARFVDHTYGAVRSAALAFLKVAVLLSAMVHSLHGLRVRLNHFASSHAADLPRIKALEKEFKGIDAQVKDLTKTIGRGIGHDLRIRIKALERWEKGAEHAIDTTIPQSIAGVAGDVAGLKQWLGIKLGVNYKDWAAGLVLAGLAALGLGGLRCDNLSKNLDKRGCSQWGALDDLLGLLALGIVAANFDDLVHEAQDLTSGAVTVFDDVFGLTR